MFYSDIAGDSDTQQSLLTCLGPLGEATEIEMILMAKVSNEGDIAGVFVYKTCQCKRAIMPSLIFLSNVKRRCPQGLTLKYNTRLKISAETNALAYFIGVISEY